MIPTQALSNFLQQQGYTGSLPQALSEYLASKGFSGNVNETLFEFLGTLAYMGTLADRMAAWTRDDLALPAVGSVTPNGTISPFRLQNATGTLLVPTASAFTVTGGTPTYSLVSPPSGVTINPTTGEVSVPSSVRRVNNINVKAQVGSSEATQTFSHTVGSRYGIAIPKNEIFGQSVANRAAMLDKLVAMGIKEVRTDMIWMDVQTTSAAPNWANWPGSEYVTIANDLAARGIDLVYTVHMTPSWARLSGANYNGPGNPSDYAAFCANVANHFTSAGRRLIAIEIWNEPNLSGPSTFWQYGRPASELAAMHIAAYNAVKALSGAAGQVKVGMGGLSAVPTSGGTSSFYYTAATAWFNDLMAVPGWKAANDFYAIHPYTYPYPWNDGQANNDGLEITLLLRNIAIAQGEGSKPWWFTEYGASTNAATATVTNTQQRQMFWDLFDWTANPANSWATKFHWYSFADRQPLTSTEREDGFGIYLNDRTTEKLVPAAMRGIKVGTQSLLQPFYGVGPGKITIHLDSDSTTKDGSGNVTAFQNKGGAGPMFNATVVGTPIPLNGKTLALAGSATGTPELANSASLIDVRLMWVSTVVATNGLRYFGDVDAMGGTDDYEIRLNASGTDVTFQMWDNEGGTGGAITPMPRFASASGLHLFEIDINSATSNITVFMDGVQYGQVAWTGAFSQFYIRRIGQGTGSSLQFEGQMGDILGVTLGTGSAAAIAAARSHLNTRFNLGLNV